MRNFRPFFYVCLWKKQLLFSSHTKKSCSLIYFSSTEDTVQRSSLKSKTPGVTKRWKFHHLNIPLSVQSLVSDRSAGMTLIPDLLVLTHPLMPSGIERECCCRIKPCIGNKAHYLLCSILLKH